MNESPELLFSEVQYSRQWWLWAVILTTTLLTAGIFAYALVQQVLFHRPFGNTPMSNTGLILMGAAVIFFDAVLLSLFLAAKLVTEVRSDGLYIRYFPFHLRMHNIPLENLDKVEPITYSPLGDYGGWGIRFGKNGRAYNPTGNRGVKLTYANGSHILIGSQRPHELAQAIESVSGSPPES